MYKYTHLISENVAPTGATGVAAMDKNGNRVCTIPLGPLKLPDLGPIKYTGGILSDAHTTTISSMFGTAEDSQADLTRAVRYFAQRAKYLFESGDLCSFCDDGGLEKHMEIVNANKGDMEHFPMPGNHEHFSIENKVVPMTDAAFLAHTGRPLRYWAERDGDVFIMCGAVTWGAVFDQAGIQWLYEMLEQHRNKRCFVFTHCPLKGAQYCGDAAGIVNTVDMMAAHKNTFLALLAHYKNVIWMHGHTHVMAQMQDYLRAQTPPLPANYDFACGVHSFHIPSGAYPRDISSGEKINMFGESQGVLMEAYERHIVMRYIDFVAGTEIPIAQYCVETPLVDIPAGTFADPTGTITV